MAERGGLPQVDFERALRELGPRYPHPPTPHLAGRVRARLIAQPAAPTRRWSRLLGPPDRAPLWSDPRRLALAAAVLVFIAAAAALVTPASREAIAHFFHVRGVTVVRAPSPPASRSPQPPLDLGRRVTLTEAQAQVAFPIAVPRDVRLGDPDAVYLDLTVPGGEVAFAYGPRPGIPLVRETGLGVLITEFRGDLAPNLILKEAGPGTRVEETSVNGDPGWWLEGSPHTIVIKENETDARPEGLRLAANTLVWEHAGVTYRIESSLSKAEALQIAASLP